MRILHAADLHLDSPFEGLSREEAARRRREQRDMLGRLADLCVKNAVSLVLLSGDLFDGETAYPETEETLCRALGAMEVPVFIAPGNHDFWRRGGGYARMALPGNVRVFSENAVTAVELPELGARVWGAAFTDRYAGPLLRGFSVEKRPGTLDLLCLHGEVGNPDSRYDPVSEAELSASNLDYAAFGHIHAFSGARTAGRTCYAWPGCPQGRGFDETGEKGVILADAAPGQVSLRFLPLGGRRYEIVTADASGDETAAAQAAVPAGAERDTYRLILTGEREDAPDLPAIRRALAGRVDMLQLRDETRLRRDVWARAGEDSLRGLFLARLHTMLKAAKTDEERARITRAARWGLAALDGREAPEEL